MRKIAILILLALALLVAIFLPLLAEAVNVNAEAVESVKPFKIRLFAFLFLSTALLLWVGWPIGWNFAVEQGYGLYGRLFWGYLTLWISLPVALFQLFITRD